MRWLGDWNETFFEIGVVTGLAVVGSIVVLAVALILPFRGNAALATAAALVVMATVLVVQVRKFLNPNVEVKEKPVGQAHGRVISWDMPESGGRNQEQLMWLLKECLPSFRLPNGKEPQQVSITVKPATDQSFRRGGLHASAYTDGHEITMSSHTLSYTRDRQKRVILHELVHVWMIQAGVVDNGPHGREFMKKALEVGAYGSDEF
jgi:hypothetical protein